MQVEAGRADVLDHDLARAAPTAPGEWLPVVRVERTSVRLDSDDDRRASIARIGVAELSCRTLGDQIRHPRERAFEGQPLACRFQQQRHSATPSADRVDGGETKRELVHLGELAAEEICPELLSDLQPGGLR